MRSACPRSELGSSGHGVMPAGMLTLPDCIARRMTECRHISRFIDARRATATLAGRRADTQAWCELALHLPVATTHR